MRRHYSSYNGIILPPATLPPNVKMIGSADAPAGRRNRWLILGSFSLNVRPRARACHGSDIMR